MYSILQTFKNASYLFFRGLHTPHKKIRRHFPTNYLTSISNGCGLPDKFLPHFINYQPPPYLQYTFR